MNSLNPLASVCENYYDRIIISMSEGVVLVINFAIAEIRTNLSLPISLPPSPFGQQPKRTLGINCEF